MGHLQLMRVAWRNLWRNTRRTVITASAVAFNTAILIITLAHTEGIMRHILANTLNIVTGEAQIHDPEYLVRRSMYDMVDEPEAVMQRLREAGVPAVARSYGYGLAARETKSAGARFWGVDPAAEGEVFDLVRQVQEGKFIGNEPRMGVVLGKKLARSLDAKVGSELVAVVQAADGSLGNELIHVTGILKTVGEGIDRSAAILHKADFEQLFVSGGRVHEIAVNTRRALPLETVLAIAQSAAPADEARTWRQLMPGISDMFGLVDVSMAIFGAIFYLAAGLGVLNTLVMATFERFREFGIVKAIGGSPWHIVRGVAAEAWMLGLIGSVAGVVLGLAGAWYLQVHGLDTTAFVSGDTSMGGVAFDPVWHARITPGAVIYPPVIMCLVCVVASLYPAAIAARLDPVKTMQHV